MCITFVQSWTNVAESLGRRCTNILFTVYQNNNVIWQSDAPNNLIFVYSALCIEISRSLSLNVLGAILVID